MQIPNYESLLNRHNNLRGELVARKRMFDMEQTRLRSLQAIVEKNCADILDFQAAINLCRVCIQEQASAKEHVENVLTTLLNGVMQGVHDYYELAGDMPVYAYKLEAVEDEVGALTGLKPTVYKNGTPDDPKNFGGGVQNLLKLGGDLLHVLLNPTVSPVVIFDEPCTNLSPKAWRFVVRFMEDLQKDLNIQMIAITHSGAQFPSTWVVWREGQTSYAMFDEQSD